MSILNTFAAGTVANPSLVNANFADIAAEITASLPRDGRAAMTDTLVLIPGTAADPAVRIGEDGPGFYADATGIALVDGDGRVILHIGQNGIDYSNLPFEIDRTTPVGDFLDTVRTLSVKWLRRNGAELDVSAYPDLAPLIVPTAPQLFWNARVSGVSATLRTIAVSGSYIVAAGGDGTSPVIIRSSDGGVSWSPISFADTRVIRSLSDAGSKLLAVGDGGLVAVSADNGATWSIETVGSSDLRSASFNETDGHWYVVGANGAFMKKDVNALSWTQPLANAYDFTAVCASNFGADAVTSDGRYITFNFAAVNVVYPVIEGQNLRAFVPVGPDVARRPGLILGNFASGTQSVFRNFLGWLTGGNLDASFVASQQQNAGAFGYGGFTLIVGNGGTAYVAPAGRAFYESVPWNPRTTGVTDHLLAVIWHEATKRFVIAGASGRILTADTASSEKFIVPNNGGTYGWIKAKL